MLILNVHYFLIADSLCQNARIGGVEGQAPQRTIVKALNCKCCRSRWQVLDVQAMMTYTVMRFLAQAQELALPVTLSMLSYHTGLKSS